MASSFVGYPVQNLSKAYSQSSNTYKMDFLQYFLQDWIFFSRNKNSRTMKFGQLIEYKQRNIFIQKSCAK